MTALDDEDGVDVRVDFGPDFVFAKDVEGKLTPEKNDFFLNEFLRETGTLSVVDYRALS